MLASVKASRYSANPKGLALAPIQTKDAGGCGARQRQFALHRMPNCCVLSRARREARTVRGAPWGGRAGMAASTRREARRAEARAQQTAPGWAGIVHRGYARSAN